MESSFIKRTMKGYIMDERQRLKELLIEKSYRKGTFTLTSGKTSDFYVDGKQVALIISANGYFICLNYFYDKT